MYKIPVCKNLIILAAVFLLINKVSEAQGCSDAGFCSIGTFKHIPETGDKFKHRLSWQFPVGTGDENVFVFAPAIQYEIMLKQLTVQAKITGNYASGNLGSAIGPGDIYLTGSYSFPSKTKWMLQATAGIKLPLSQSKLSENGMPLPLQYQSSLGTVDIISGATVTNKSWNASVAWQQPLTKTSKNGFLPEYWNGKPDAADYPPSNRLQRKADLLLRIGKNFSAGTQWQFNAGLLNIYHLGKDKYTAIQPVQREVTLEGSDGLTVNITGSVFYQFNKSIRLGIAAGVPLVVRDIRPDGLTRRWVIAPEISWQF